eukprot:TRINITY_DN14355_c0_g4_i1.p1 TRINITY_DN14355_c0_g4~~TRINITY_DN14355_c0_g4_i1.p1  ORF type:complete len:114 (+),score=6.04 TRINITY_DN14355_c0_g4_i1:287-628(+)
MLHCRSTKSSTFSPRYETSKRGEMNQWLYPTSSVFLLEIILLLAAVLLRRPTNNALSLHRTRFMWLQLAIGTSAHKSLSSFPPINTQNLVSVTGHCEQRNLAANIPQFHRGVM